MSDRQILNFSNADTKRQVLARVGALTGEWEVLFKKWKPKRSNRANSFWWACVVPTLRQFFADQGQHFSPEQIHYMLVDDLRGYDVVNKDTGEWMGRVVPETHTMNTEEFGKLVDDAINRIAQKTGAMVPDPSIFRGAA